eukprot:jgi/Botrbrau1/7092/Bobra.0165s0114.1
MEVTIIAIRHSQSRTLTFGDLYNDFGRPPVLFQAVPSRPIPAVAAVQRGISVTDVRSVRNFVSRVLVYSGGIRQLRRTA